jgi:hypothetical protein
MTNEEAADLMTRNLGRLPACATDSASAAKVRSRCHAVLTRQIHKADRAARRRRFARRAVEPVAVCGFGLIYLVAVIRDVLRM